VRPEFTPYVVHWTKAAAHDLRGLAAAVSGRVHAALKRFADSGLGDVREMVGMGGERRMRVGDYRVRFTVHDADRDGGPKVILVLRVAHRREVYR